MFLSFQCRSAIAFHSLRSIRPRKEVQRWTSHHETSTSSGPTGTNDSSGIAPVSGSRSRHTIACGIHLGSSRLYRMSQYGSCPARSASVHACAAKTQQFGGTPSCLIRYASATTRTASASAAIPTTHSATAGMRVSAQNARSRTSARFVRRQAPSKSRRRERCQRSLGWCR